MFWMIIAPELALAWVVRQLFAAKDLMGLLITTAIMRVRNKEFLC
jgi:hypothetical protein